ncbi:MAG: DUF4439 domain-containing protein [Actinomycetales bacterium]|nr:DUF4439 domain-containing protein [Actinomycetales bacterium]
MSEQQARNAAIAGEDACIYAYGIIGAHLAAAGQRKARRALDSHRAWRDRLLAAGDYVPGSAAYELPFPVQDAAAARRLAILVEQRMVPAYADLAASTSGDLRAQAVQAGCECAARSVAWGGPTQAFPGLDSPAAQD